jgi:hypothetical protein
MSDRPQVYLILGAAGSGRREIVADLIEAGLDGADGVHSRLAAGEAASAVDARLGTLERWSWADGRIAASPPAPGATVFFFADGRGNPVDQIEAFQAWLAGAGGELARILCVVHCDLVAQHPPMLVWYDACIHFADVVLFNRRDGVTNKWFSDFRAHYAAQFLPCLFEVVKRGRVANPALILEPQARRLSHFFDAEPEWEAADGDEETEGEVEMQPVEDPYLQRLAGGRRVKVIPDIAKYLA